MTDNVSKEFTSFELAMTLGEIRAQVRELIHTVSDKTQRDEALGRAVAKLEAIPEDISEIRKSMGALESRLTTLEIERHRQEGERGVLGAIMRAPMMGWVIGLVTAAWALLSGRVDIAN